MPCFVGSTCQRSDASTLNSSSVQRRRRWATEASLRSSSPRRSPTGAQTRITRSVRKAKFPFLRTVEEFDFTFQTSVRLKMLGSLLGPELVSEARSAVVSGLSGGGKTHLAVAIAYRAIQNGFEAHFTTADELIGDLSRAAAEARLDSALKPDVHPGSSSLTNSATRAKPPTPPRSSTALSTTAT